MKTVLLAAALTVFAGQASALRCAFSGGAAAYGEAQYYGDDFRTVIGTLTWDTTDESPLDNDGEDISIGVRFTGEVVLPQGERAAIQEDITLRFTCINGDCGYAAPDVEMVSFIHATDDGPVMYAFPCSNYPMGVDALELMQSCVDGGPCDAGDIQ